MNVLRARVPFAIIGTIIQIAALTALKPTTVFGQTPSVVQGVVIVNSGYLRERPSTSSPATARVPKGTKLYLVATPLAKGWYYASPTDRKVYGYIHGNSVRLINSDSPSRAATPKYTRPKDPGILPKSIILDTSPSVDVVKSAPSSTPLSEIPKLKNHCAGILFCADIGDVYTGLSVAEPTFAKGKFEKTSEWEVRKQSLLKTIHFGGTRTAADTMTFLYEQGTGSLVAAEATYDADAEKWTFPINLFSIPPSSRCVPMMGEKTGGLLCLVISDIPELKDKVIVPMSPSVASQNNEKLQIAFVGKITSPFIWNQTYEKTDGIATGIYLDLEEIICVNPKTGQQWKVQRDISTVREAPPFAKPEMKTDLGSASAPSKAEPNRQKTSSVDPVAIEDAQILVQDVFARMAGALEKKDFTVFHSSLASQTKIVVTPEMIKKDAESLLDRRRGNLEILRALPGYRATFYPQPYVVKSEDGEFLYLVGVFNTQVTHALRTDFNFTFVREDGVWRLQKYNVKIGN